MTLVQLLKYYFLGTGLSQWYDHKRQFYEEFYLDEKDFKSRETHLKNFQDLELILSRYLPNLVDVAVIGYSLFPDKNIYSWIVYGEAVRLGSSAIFYGFKKRRDKQEKWTLERLSELQKRKNEIPDNKNIDDED